jgi:hypothetical protein
MVYGLGDDLRECEREVLDLKQTLKERDEEIAILRRTVSDYQFTVRSLQEQALKK